MTDEHFMKMVNGMINEASTKAKDEIMEAIKFHDVTKDQMIDILMPSHVEVKIRFDGKVVWVNVNGICKFRAKVSELELIDERHQLPTPIVK